MAVLICNTFPAVCVALLILFPVAPAMRSLPGGLREVTNPENDLEAEDLAKFAVAQHNAQKNSDLEYAGIVSAHKQVVSGLMYHFKLKAASGGRTDVYEAKVWLKPWEKFKSLELFKKAESSIKPADLGAHAEGSEQLGLRAVPSDDPAVKEAAKEALKSIQGRSNSLVPYELKEVVSAHAEVKDDNTLFHLMLKTQRGSKEEHFKADISRTVVGAWTLKNFHQHH